MTLTYNLTADDYLQHQLFIASKSEAIKKKRIKSRVIATAASFLLALLFSQAENKIFSYSFFAWGIVTLFFYPRYLRNHYKKHYEQFISTTFKNSFDDGSTVTFDEDSIHAIDATGEMKINSSQIEQIVETGTHVFVRLKTSGSLIIPQSRIENRDEVQTALQELAKRLNIAYVKELNWKWK
ncbi:MAG: YcxB family protein [Ferruginibacter sp.]